MIGTCPWCPVDALSLGLKGFDVIMGNDISKGILLGLMMKGNSPLGASFPGTLKSRSWLNTA